MYMGYYDRSGVRTKLCRQLTGNRVQSTPFTPHGGNSLQGKQFSLPTWTIHNSFPPNGRFLCYNGTNAAETCVDYYVIQGEATVYILPCEDQQQQQQERSSASTSTSSTWSIVSPVYNENDNDNDNGDENADNNEESNEFQRCYEFFANRLEPTDAYKDEHDTNKQILKEFVQSLLQHQNLRRLCTETTTTTTTTDDTTRTRTRPKAHRAGSTTAAKFVYCKLDSTNYIRIPVGYGVHFEPTDDNDVVSIFAESFSSNSQRSVLHNLETDKAPLPSQSHMDDNEDILNEFLQDLRNTPLKSGSSAGATARKRKSKAGDTSRKAKAKPVSKKRRVHAAVTRQQEQENPSESTSTVGCECMSTTAIATTITETNVPTTGESSSNTTTAVTSTTVADTDYRIPTTPNQPITNVHGGSHSRSSQESMLLSRHLPPPSPSSPYSERSLFDRYQYGSPRSHLQSLGRRSPPFMNESQPDQDQDEHTAANVLCDMPSSQDS
jgi:hypothetical protein